MKAHLFRIIGKVLFIVGFILLLLLSFLIYSAATYTGEYGPLPPFVVLLPVFWIGDFGLICLGVFMLRRYRERDIFLAKGGEPIHSVNPWEKGSEPGLYLTSCGVVVSTNQETNATGHVGYRIVPAKRATCSDCIRREGKLILDSVDQSRDGM
ncbi:MAG: hypothetical protein RTU63_10275 [Candidatus Thorarchaeota archaeon]